MPKLYYCSSITTKALLEKLAVTLERIASYYWLTDEEVGRELQQAIKNCTYYAEGLIGIVRDSEFLDERCPRPLDKTV